MKTKRKPMPQQMAPKRANPPGSYRCPCCGETLSGPARLYVCPNRRWG